MRPRTTLVMMLAPVALAGWLRADGPPAVPNPRQDPEVAPFAFLLSADQAIQLFRDRVKADPLDPCNHVLLGQMYIRKARATGRLDCYAPAEAAIRQALKLDPDYLPGRACLALIHGANHQFSDGLRLAQELCRQYPNESELLMIVGDAQLELGNYQEAERTYQDLRRRKPFALLTTRLARLAELHGDIPRAVALMRQAAEEERLARLSREGGAWFEVRLGDLHWSQGRLEDAARHYQAALVSCADCAPALAGLGQVRAAQRNTTEALALYTRAARVNADCHTLSALADLYLQTDKKVLADILYDRLERLAAENRGAFNRELALFYANHDRKLPQALDLARKDLAVRKDIYAYDTLAWALHKNGREAEAATAIAAALKLGTRDASLAYHAGMIFFRLGQKDRARGYLAQALAWNPHFAPLLAEEARRTLTALGSPP